MVQVSNAVVLLLLIYCCYCSSCFVRVYVWELAIVGIYQTNQKVLSFNLLKTDIRIKLF